MPTHAFTPAFSAIGALWRREIVKFVRDRSRLFGAIAQPLGFWLLLGLGFQGTFRMPVEGAADMGYMEFLFPGIIALIVLFTAIFSTISIVEERKSGFLQAALLAPISRHTLVFGNTLGGTTLAVGEAALFLMLLPFIGIFPSLAGLAVILLITLLTGIAFTSLGFAIAWRMESTRGFHAVMNLFLLPMWILSGAFFPVEGAPAVLRYVMYANPVTYVVSGIRQGLYLPAEAPIAAAPLAVCLFVAVAFAGVMLFLAARVASRPMFDAR
jgi:ABC-2 type transport system permease protein